MGSFKRALVKIAAGISLAVAAVGTVSAAANSTTQTVSAASKKTKQRNAVVKLAKKQVGKGYVYGATGPNSFDCSGLTQYVFNKAANVDITRTTYSQVDVGKKVSLNKLKKGDLLFWGSSAAPYHVAVYVGNDSFVHAATPDQGVIKEPLNWFYPSFAKRVL